MSLITASFRVEAPADFKQRLLAWLQTFPCYALLDSNGYKHDTRATYDCLAGCADALLPLSDQPFRDVGQRTGNNFLFGYFGYDLKNGIERLVTAKPNRTGFPDACFFESNTTVELIGNTVIVTSVDPARTFEEIVTTPLLANEKISERRITVHQRTRTEKFLQTVDALRGQIAEGDFYEINYCQEFFSEDAELNPAVLFSGLNESSPAPFAALFRFKDKFMISSSPERFLKKTGNRIVTQPIKGTTRRDMTNADNDYALKEELRTSEKERAENVMIVDLCRNDLNRVCKPASVNVDELFGVYSFPNLHHMISTVSGELFDSVTLEEIFHATFPMGSMTGAPKVEVMKAIDGCEDTARGAYAGCAGYVAPNGDFDFNVLIRTVLWNAASRYLSFHAGSAITFDSDARAEHEECLLKVKRIAQILES